MSRVRFQKLTVVRLPLSEGDWVEVRERLSGVEKKRMSASAFQSLTQGKEEDKPQIGVDFAILTVARTKAYLVDWNFKDENDKPVKFSEDAIDALDEDTLKEIETALDKHIAEQDAKKQLPSGEATSSSGSPAVATSAGAGSNT